MSDEPSALDELLDEHRKARTDRRTATDDARKEARDAVDEVLGFDRVAHEKREELRKLGVAFADGDGLY